MAAAAADKSKRLPKELQDYKREIKKLPFKDRVKAYFDCSPFINDLDGQKMDIILSTFSKSEKEEYYRLYQPIYSAIDRYGDRIRAINGNRIIYDNFIGMTLRKRDSISYTGDFLNLVLKDISKALIETKEQNTRETLGEALKTLKGYYTTQSPRIKINKEGMYDLDTEEEDKFLLGAINTLKGLLSLLKCYLEALKEFLEWVGTPELLPKEFKDLEDDLLIRFRRYEKSNVKSPEADKFPLLFRESKVKEEYVPIDYLELPRTIDIFGEKNLFANAYRRFFNY